MISPFTASQNSTSCKMTDAYELFLSGAMRKDPFMSTLLESFIESSNNNAALFVRAHNVSLEKPTSAIQMALQLNGTIKFGPLKFPNMFIRTEMYSEELRRCNGDAKVPGLSVSATFNQETKLGRFFTSIKSDSVQMFIPADHQNNTYGIFNSTVALLNHSFQAQVAVSNTSIRFEGEIKLLHRYRISFNASGRLQPWDFLLLKVTGLFQRSNSGFDTLEDKMKEVINEYIRIVVEHTVHRVRALKTVDDKMKARLDRSKQKLAQAENNTHLAVTRYLWALKAHHAAVKEVRSAEKNVSNGNQEISQLKASLERLCTVTGCPFVCVTGTACNTCYKDLITKEQGICPATCHNILKERLPPFKEMASCLEEKCKHSGGGFFSFVGCTFEKVGRSVLTAAAKGVITYGLVSVGVPPNIAYPIASGAVTYAVTGDSEEAVKSAAIAGAMQGVDYVTDGAVSPTDSKAPGLMEGLADAEDCGEGSWDCRVEPYPCEKSVFNYKFSKVPYSCDISCQVNVIKETVTTSCCKEVNCASRMKDLKCREKNVFCRITREKALAKLNAARRKLSEPLVKLHKAKKNLAVVESELAKQTIELEAASNERNILRRAHDALVKAANISRKANDQNRALIQDAISLEQLWRDSNQTCPVDVKEISFDFTLSAPSETKIPVLFKTASNNREKTIFAIVNFVSMDESLNKVAKQIVKELFGNVNAVLRSGHPMNQLTSAQGKERRKRAIDDENDDDSGLTTLVAFKRKCALVTNYKSALREIIGSLHNISTESLQILNNITNSSAAKPNRAKDHEFTVNLTQAVELGLTESDVNDSKNAVSEDEEVVGAASLLEQRNTTNLNKVQAAMAMVYRDWEASMESVFNFTSLECNGFVDCMEDFVDNLYYLYQGVELPEAVRLQQQLTVLGTEVKSLVSAEDLTVSEAAEKSFRILAILQEIKEEKIFCAIAPNITNHPTAMRNIKTGLTLELTCRATGDPAPSYRWKKNGRILPGINTENLRIKNVTTNDSGNYTCEAYNHVSVESSTPTHVLVHLPPTLVYQPPGVLNIPINTGFYLRCNATTVVRPLRYQWLFMRLGGDKYIVIQNGNFSVLKLSSVQKHEEGFYKCNVSNPFAYTLSQSIQVRVLGFSLVVPSLKISFEIVGGKKSLPHEEGNAVNSSAKLLSEDDQFQNDVKFSFIRVINSMVNLSSNAVQAFTTNDCRIIDGDNITCDVSFRLRSFNVTGPEFMESSEEQNALSVMQSFNRLKRSIAVLVNESSTRGISFNVRNGSFKVNPLSWSVGEYRYLCPKGTTLFGNNFICGK